MRRRRTFRLLTVGALTAALYWLFVRPWHLRWGATDAEVFMPWPGDEHTPEILPGVPGSSLDDESAHLSSTHAITICAPVTYVWPWLVQLGQGRGGFYGYAWLEKLIGFYPQAIHTILPQYQKLQVGDRITLYPRVPPLPVTRLEAERALVLGDAWAFVLEPLDSAMTRLIVRTRGRYAPGLLNFLIWRILYEPAHFLMERAMLLGIKARAEALAVAQGTLPQPDAEPDVVEDFKNDFTPG